MIEADTQTQQPAIEVGVCQRRLEIARRAFQEFHAQCFWSYRKETEITEADIPWIVRELRHNGGHRGYRIVADLCR